VTPSEIKKKQQVLEKLPELANDMLIGSLSETYRTCGQPSCRCHTTGPKHGPHLYVSYKNEEGRSTGYYVPERFHEKVRAGIAAWKEFQALAKRVAQLNQKLIAEEKAAGLPPKKKGARPAHS
jgi:hypothetical protein